MLIHLHTPDGRAVITIDPEGEPIPMIETVPGLPGTFRLSWAGEARREGRPDASRIGSSSPDSLSVTPLGKAAGKPGRRPLGRYAAVTGAFAAMLAVGMVIGTLRDNPMSGPDITLPVARVHSSSSDAPFTRAESTPSAMQVEAPVNEASALRPEQDDASAPSGSALVATPSIASPPIASTPLAPAPVAPAGAAATSVPVAPVPAHPGALFGLHS